MTKFNDTKSMKYALWLVFLFSSIHLAWANVYQHGTVVRMRMVDCLPVHHGFMATMGGAPMQMSPEVCPEYTLVSEKVVFVIVGKSSDQLVPLADLVDFRFQKNELAMRVDDAKESKFTIKEMILRSDWDLVQKHIADEMNNPPQPGQTSLTIRTRN